LTQITQLLQAASTGDRLAADRLFEAMYQELKQLAHSSLRRSGSPAELDTTSLVHESFLRLVGSDACTPAHRRAFYSYVGKVMRSVVLDTVRERRARKRGGDQEFVTLDTGVGEAVLDDRQLLAVDEALTTLGALAPDLKELVEMRYFAGLTVAEIADLTGKSVRSVEREWEKSRLLLRRLMEEG